jgi:glycosyltransferase involved in cell wall biosynthesis
VYKRPQSIGIVTKPMGQAAVTPLSNLVNIVQSLSDATYVITGSAAMNLTCEKQANTHILEIPYQYRPSLYVRAFFHFLMQIRISWKIIKLRNRVDSWIYFLDSQALLMPVLTTKLLRKKIIFSLAASLKSDKARTTSLNKLLIYSENFNNRFADKIVVYSPNIVGQWSLAKYKGKIAFAHEHYIDSTKFGISKPLDERDNLVGYVGRFSEEKGPLKIVQAIPQVLREMKDLNFLIAGDGHLRAEIEKELKENNLGARVNLPGWIAHEHLPQVFNELKLIVLPSDTEGLPNIMLEAMACGTPVLATRVGAIPDFIQDGVNGFLMDNNSPECIAKNIVRALSDPDLEQIAGEARKLIEEEFTLDKAVAKYSEVLKELER